MSSTVTIQPIAPLKIRAGAWSKSDGAEPPYRVLRQILDKLQAELAVMALDRGTRLRPTCVASAQSWVLPRATPDNVYTEIAIEFVPGTSAQSLRCWFQWQHAGFTWSPQPAPRAAIEQLQA